MRAKLLKKAVLLAWFTIAYNLLEGAVSIGFGVSDDSIALAGFGVDSLIEVASAFAVLWRFRAEARGETVQVTERERSATRAIGVLFLLLAAATIAGSALQLSRRGHPDSTTPGIMISLLSLSFMVFLWRAKRRLATELDSSTVRQDAACSLACIQLSVILLAGSAAFALFPALYWADSVAAIALALLIAREGWETLQAAAQPGFTGGCGCGTSCHPGKEPAP